VIEPVRSKDSNTRKGKRIMTTATQQKKRVQFKFKTQPGKRIMVAGTFNNWDPNKNKLKEKNEGEYATTLQIPIGRHEYKFVVDGVWQIDETNQAWVPNDEGSLNSVIIVG
jgi:1,4-alpha-glucan branching enzyme